MKVVKFENGKYAIERKNKFFNVKEYFNLKKFYWSSLISGLDDYNFDDYIGTKEEIRQIVKYYFNVPKQNKIIKEYSFDEFLKEVSND